MAIVGVGTDLVDCSRIEQMIRRHGDRFVRRVFSEAEMTSVLWFVTRKMSVRAWQMWRI